MSGNVSADAQPQGVEGKSCQEDPSGIGNDFGIHRTSCKKRPEIESHQQQSRQEIEERKIPENIDTVIEYFKILFDSAGNQIRSQFVLKLVDQGKIRLLARSITRLDCTEVIGKDLHHHRTGGRIGCRRQVFPGSICLVGRGEQSQQLTFEYQVGHIQPVIHLDDGIFISSALRGLFGISRTYLFHHFVIALIIEEIGKSSLVGRDPQ